MGGPLCTEFSINQSYLEAKLPLYRFATTVILNFTEVTRIRSVQRWQTPEIATEKLRKDSK